MSEGLTVQQFYEKPGTYEFSLTAFIDNNSSSTEKFKIKILEEEIAPISTTTPITTEEILFTKIPYIFISEFLPNPTGKDLDGEFIEIFSQDDKVINLKNFRLTDATDKHFILPEILIKPGQYLSFPRSQTKIALNNDEDEIKLLTPDKQIIDLVNYEDPKEGFSFVLDENFIWQQTKTPTPNEMNTLEQGTILDSTTTPQILGVQTEEIIINEPKNKDKYFTAGIASITVLGLGAILKIKKQA